MNKDLPPLPDLTIDREIGTRLRQAGWVQGDEDLSVLHERQLFIQAVRGYRFGIDAVVLARRALDLLRDRRDSSGATLLDIGTGCGVVAILVAAGAPDVRVTAVEVQPAQADRARRNLVLNDLAARVTLEQADLNEWAVGQGGRFDLILSNPPFYRAGSGRLNPDGEKAIARHEIRLDMAGLLFAISVLLSPAGRAVVLYPSERLDECLGLVSRHALAVDVLVPLLPAPGAPAESYLIELIHAPAGPDNVLKYAPPMYLSRDV